MSPRDTNAPNFSISISGNQPFYIHCSRVFMSELCEFCLRTYNSDFFNSIYEGSHLSVEFQQNITFGCLLSLVTWANSKQQTMKSSTATQTSDDMGIPSLSSSSSSSLFIPSLSDIVHTVIRKIDTFGCGSSIERYS